MKRRSFIKVIATLPLLPSMLYAKDGKVQAGEAAAPTSSAATGTAELPDYAKNFLTSDMDGLGPDGKPTGMRATFTGASKVNSKAEEAMQHRMKLTKEEQAILNGSE